MWAPCGVPDQLAQRGDRVAEHRILTKSEAERGVSLPPVDRVGVVVAGAGARGAYEAGALSVLLPALERAGARPTVFVGASAGAINATLMAGLAHLPADEVGTAMLDVWRTTTRSDVFRSLLLTAPVTALRYGAEFLGLPLPRLTGLLDTSPQQALAEGAIDWDQLQRNVRDGRIGALAVVATTAASGRTMVFVGHSDAVTLPATDPDRALDYVSTQVGPAHVLASSAIPAAFPAVAIDEPPQVADWYTDGGVRLNTPIKPALDLGVSHVVVVATHPARYPPAAHLPGEKHRPEVDDMVVQVLEAAMVDRMVEDVRTLGKLNELVVGGGQRPYAGRAYRVVPYLFAGPGTRRDVGVVAREVFAEQYGGFGGALKALRDPDIPLLRRLMTDTDGPREGDLLSFLYFEPAFMDAAIELGQQDAARLLESAEPGQLPWRVFP